MEIDAIMRDERDEEEEFNEESATEEPESSIYFNPYVDTQRE